VTDGVSDSPLLTSAAAIRAHQADITLFAVGVGTGIQVAELESIASAPVCQQVILLDAFKEFASLSGIIEKRTCTGLYRPT